MQPPIKQLAEEAKAQQSPDDFVELDIPSVSAVLTVREEILADERVSTWIAENIEAAAGVMTSLMIFATLQVMGPEIPYTELETPEELEMWDADYRPWVSKPMQESMIESMALGTIISDLIARGDSNE